MNQDDAGDQPDRDVRNAQYAEIIENLRQGGPARRAAVGQLYDLFAGRLRKHFCAKGASAAQAEDWLHEVFVRLLRSSAEFRGAGGQLAAWIWTIARHIMTDARRQAGGRTFEDIDGEAGHDLPADASEPLAALQATSLVSCVQTAYADFAKIHPNRAQYLTWLVTDEMTTQQIAQVIGRTEGATREYLSQCRKKLQPFLERCRWLLPT